MAKTEIIKLSAVTDAGMLRDAADLVRQGWTRSCSGRDEDGNGIGYDQPEAVCFCAQGAVFRAVMDRLGGEQRIVHTHLFEETTDRLSRYVVDVLDKTDLVLLKPDSSEKPDFMIIQWNDRPATRQDDVVAVLEKAATLARSSPTNDEKTDA